MHHRSPHRLLAGLAFLFASHAAHAADADRWDIPVATKKLDNGLTVVVSEDHSSPTVGVSGVYHVGMRLEPRNRTGFAHLFEHLMFEGTPNAPEGAFAEPSNIRCSNRCAKPVRSRGSSRMPMP